MNESKFKRLVAAATATAVVLLVLLLSVMIFQLASINNERAKQREYEAAIALYEQMIADGEDGIKIKQQRWYIEKMARELGYCYETDVPMSGE